MITTIVKIGGSEGILLDATLIQQAHLEVGDQLNMELNDDGSITLSPLDPRPSREGASDTIRKALDDYSRTTRKLE